MSSDGQLSEFLESVRRKLLEARNADGIWEGRLSSSPLATAVAVFAFHITDSTEDRELIAKGLRWLDRMQHADGGWGDAEQLDPPNLSSTLLCYAAIRCIAPGEYAAVLKKAELWIARQVGSLEPQAVANAVYNSYGQDRTFAVPILTMGALAGMLGADGWKFVKAMPFELALLPRAFFCRLKLTVVSYALPALIAIGQAKNHFDPPCNPLIRMLRRLAAARTLRLLECIQPSNGGFLEAVPLTAFVVMSLAGIGQKDHPVVQKGLEFLKAGVRLDGSWPIDTNLATWCTSLAVEALLKQTPEEMPLEWRKQVTDWYIRQQFKEVHSYTGAAPGGWGWTHLPGAVPDADDTAGALIALHRLGLREAPVLEAVPKGLIWLLDLQNADGGIPTFCRGWGRLEFDRSCPDITAHAIKAWQLWIPDFDCRLQSRLSFAVRKALHYLELSQKPEGSWQPLWFGNPFLKDHANPVFGTARVLRGIEPVRNLCPRLIQAGVHFLVSSQNPDSGWGARKGAISTIEETCSAIEALHPFIDDTSEVLSSGMLWIYSKNTDKTFINAGPIGLYFARLWYAEDFYPLIWAYSAANAGFQAKMND